VKNFLAILVLAIVGAHGWAAESRVQPARIGDLTSVEGVRENPLIGYGMVVGLNGTGDRRQTVFTTQTLANVLQRMGVQIPAGAVRVNNAAAVFVTASLPPFAASGTHVDVTVSSIGDAKSLEGGLLLLTPLYAPDGQVYAAAQGALTVGGYNAGLSGNSRQVNHPTVGRIPGGALIERTVQLDLKQFARLRLLLRQADFSQARTIAAAINQEFGRSFAVAADAGHVEIDAAQSGVSSTPELLARIENLQVPVHAIAKVVVNERTGTIVMGREVRLGAVSVLHGNLSIDISSQFQISQPAPYSLGQTAVVSQPAVRTVEGPARRIELAEGASVDELVNGLQAIGATARDVVAILQAIKAAGALHAELEVL
jgi:flagellar P-ring protein precursor FlgI